MPSILTQSPLRDGPNGALKGVTAFAGTGVEIVGSQAEWTNIKLLPSGTQGWVRTDTIGDAAAAPDLPFDEVIFADLCVLHGQMQGVVPHYMLAVAMHRSGLTDTSDGDEIGPFRITRAQWEAHCKDPEFDLDLPTAIQPWYKHPVVFAVMARRAEKALNPTGADARPSALDLYKHQWPDEPATSDQLDRAFKATADHEIAAVDKVLDKPAEQPTTNDHFAETPSNSKISQSAYNLILEFEISSQQVYEKKYRRPIWPGVQSGVTIGIGYDVGYASAAQLENDWKGLIADDMISALKSAIDVKGVSAKSVAGQLRDKVDVPWEAAIKVHSNTVIPRWVKSVENALNNTGRLGPDCLGALVSLTYNRGAGGYSINKPRFAEMRAIKQAMKDGTFGAIAAEIRAMKRLWPTVPGLLRRREREAKLFEQGLSAPASGGPSRGAPSHGADTSNAGAAAAAGSIVDRLKAQIDAGRITFQDARFKNELLGLSAGAKVTAKLQALVLKLSEIASPIEISSVVRTGDAGHHGTGRAIDIGNEMIAKKLLPHVANLDQVQALGIDEIIFDASKVGESDPQIWNFDRGIPHRFNASTMAQHGNHIHFAVEG
jgi:GH24 family phage-related lysozyme (muramidase)